MAERLRLPAPLPEHGQPHASEPPGVALRVIAAPLKAARTLGHAIGAAFAWTGIPAVAGKISLVPYFLANLLWLLSEKFLDLARFGYGSNSAVYACLRLLSQSVPEPPLLAFIVDPKTRLEHQLPYDHPLCRLIRQPNPLMSEYEMWELRTLHMGIIGRSTWWKERNNAGEVIALWPLRPDRVGPIYTTEVEAEQAVIVGWSYLVPGTTHYLPIRREDIWFDNWPDPAGESGGVVEGMGPLQVLAAEVGADNEATRFVGSLLANHAIPGAVITTASSIPDQPTADLIKAAFNREFGGMRRGSVALLDADSKISQLGFDLQQLEFPALRKHTESRVAAAFGVPAILCGLQVGLESGVRATIAEQREYFADTTLSNYWRRYAESFSRDVAAEFHDLGEIVCKFDITKVRALSIMGNREVEKIAEGFRLGAVTIDQYLLRVLNLPPLPVGGDHRILPRGAIEVDAIGQIVQAAGIPGPAAPVGMAPVDEVPGNLDTMEEQGGVVVPVDEDRAFRVRRQAQPPLPPEEAHLEQTRGEGTPSTNGRQPAASGRKPSRG